MKRLGCYYAVLLKRTLCGPSAFGTIRRWENTCRTSPCWNLTRNTLGDDEECCYLIPVMKEHPEQRVGTCSFLPLDEGKTYDLAYCVHPYFWKQGYATEMAQGMIEYARRQGAEKVTIWVSAENAASCRVAEKCGGIAATEKTYHKRNTDLVMKEIRYDITL